MISVLLAPSLGVPCNPISASKVSAGSVRPNPKKGAPDTENASCIGFTVLAAGVRPSSRKGTDHGVGSDRSSV